MSTHNPSRHPSTRSLKWSAIAAAILTTGAVQAHDHGCEVDLDYGVTLEPKQVLLHSDNSQFTLSGGQLSKNGKVVSTSADSALLRDYEAGMRELVPQINAITKEALAVAGLATEMAFNALLGPDHEDVVAMRSNFEKLGDEIGKRMDDKHLPSRPISLQDDDWNVVGDGASLGWEVAGASFAVMGKALRAAVDENYARNWEAQVKKMEADMEKTIEPRAEALEAKADAMCATLEKLDRIEQQLVAGNASLSPFNIVQPHSDHDDADHKAKQNDTRTAKKEGSDF